ncbi:hypothetical protein Nepgr_015954 [Nepenthes gracilis]|uniref:Uncharacterized protein n=1 Tax=Nepenthes gracilis TaxID=150966 RepID=A0AAD3XR65_NEPGR|nr:hypothetical protein Nepgr_015954 [Nepenthes gracilis]
MIFHPSGTDPLFLVSFVAVDLGHLSLGGRWGVCSFLEQQVQPGSMATGDFVQIADELDQESLIMTKWTNLVRNWSAPIMQAAFLKSYRSVLIKIPKVSGSH